MRLLKIWGIAALLVIALAPSATRPVDAFSTLSPDRAAAANPMTVWVAAKKAVRKVNRCDSDFKYCVSKCAKDDFLCAQICSTDQWWCEVCGGTPC